MYNLGCIADTPDERDLKFQTSLVYYDAQGVPLPTVVFLDGLRRAIPILDQGNIGSCVAHGARTAFDALFVDKKEIGFWPSRLFIYYTGRSIEHTRDYDSGLQVRDGLKALVDVGVPDEDLWPYHTDMFTAHPPHEAYKNAFLPGHQGHAYHRLSSSILEIQRAIVAGLPVVIGFSVYTSFFGTPSSGIMPATSGRMEGGHCVTIEGYDDIKEQVICRNSWGDRWGAQGYFYMPYDFLTSENVYDLWVLTK